MIGNISLIVSVIIGAIVGLLVGSDILVVTTPLIFTISLVLSVLFLVLLVSVLGLFRDADGRCLFGVTKTLAWAIVIAIILSILALTITVPEPTLFITGLYTFLVTASFLFEIFSFKNLIICLADRRCRD